MALAFDWFAAWRIIFTPRSQSCTTPRPYIYFSPSATISRGFAACGFVGAGAGFAAGAESSSSELSASSSLALFFAAPFLFAAAAGAAAWLPSSDESGESALGGAGFADAPFAAEEFAPASAGVFAPASESTGTTSRPPGVGFAAAGLAGAPLLAGTGCASGCAEPFAGAAGGAFAGDPPLAEPGFAAVESSAFPFAAGRDALSLL